MLAVIYFALFATATALTLIPPFNYSIVFNYTGYFKTYEVPLQVKQILVDACGAQGGGSGGLGGRIQSLVNVTPSALLYVYVGGSGQTFNGGALPWNLNCCWNIGGGGTDIRTRSGGSDGSKNLTSRIVVAGGGGANSAFGGVGGAGGGLIGGTGASSRDQVGGTGGTQLVGGTGFYNSGADGGLGLGGRGDYTGGGGGYYGGGGAYCGGGGGGSSFSSGVILSNVQGDSRCSGDGKLIITPICSVGSCNFRTPPTPQPSVSPTIIPTPVPSFAADCPMGSAQIFDYKGRDQFWVASTNRVMVYLWGAGGGSAAGIPGEACSGGAGAYIQGLWSPTLGINYTIIVGQGGAFAGSRTYGGGGGGYWAGSGGGGAQSD